MAPLTRTPLRGEYAHRDWSRIARRLSIPFVLPESFPFLSTAVGRAFYWLEANDPASAREFALHAFHAHFAEGMDIAMPVNVAGLVKRHGRDSEAALAALKDDSVKDCFRGRTQEAIDKGVFGSPFFIVEGEPFWGFDRLPMLRDWMIKGGW